MLSKKKGLCPEVSILLPWLFASALLDLAQNRHHATSTRRFKHDESRQQPCRNLSCWGDSCVCKIVSFEGQFWKLELFYTCRTADCCAKKSNFCNSDCVGFCGFLCLSCFRSHHWHIVLAEGSRFTSLKGFFRAILKPGFRPNMKLYGAGLLLVPVLYCGDMNL